MSDEIELHRQIVSVPAPGTQILNPLQPNLSMSNIPPNNSLQPTSLGLPMNMNAPENLAPLSNQHLSLNQHINAQALSHINQLSDSVIDLAPSNFSGLNDRSNWTQDEVDKSSNNLPSLMSVKVDKPDDMKISKNPCELILPKALEDVFAYKDQLADELGRIDGEIPVDVEKSVHKTLTGVISTDYADADADTDEDDEVPAVLSTVLKIQHRLDKNKKKKQRKKQNKKHRQIEAQKHERHTNGEEKASDDYHKDNFDHKEKDHVAIEYVPDKITVADLAPMYRQFYRVFEVFKLEGK